MIILSNNIYYLIMSGMDQYPWQKEMRNITWNLFPGITCQCIWQIGHAAYLSSG